MAAVTALLIERQPNSRVPCCVVRSGSWVARTSQTHARRSDERDGEAGADEATYFAIRPRPFRREARGELLGSCARLSASQSVRRKHERSEGAALSQAGVNVLVLLLLLVLGQDLVRILASVVRSVGICMTRTLKIAVAPRLQNPWTPMLPQSSGGGSLPGGAAPRCRPDLSRLKVRRRRLWVRAPGRRDGATPLPRRCGGAARGLPSCRSSHDLARSDGRSHHISQGGRAERVRVSAIGCLGTRPRRALWR
jgi:hypothetical protein